MIRLPAMFRILLMAIALLAIAPAARAQTTEIPPAAAPGTPPLTTVQAQQVLEVLRDDAKRAQFISVLESMAKALPAASGAAASTAAAPQAAAHPATALSLLTGAGGASASGKLVSPLAPNSLGAEILVGASDHLSSLSLELADTARAVTDFPLFGRWLMHLASDPDSRADLLDAAWKLALVLAACLVVEHIVRRAVRGPARTLAETAPDGTSSRASADSDGAAEAGQIGGNVHRPSMMTLLHRLPYVLAHFVLELLPLLGIASVGYLLLGTPLGSPGTTRLVILAVLDAYLLCQAVIAVTRLLVAPDCPRLRLPHIPDGGARYILVWVRRIAVIGFFGYAIAEVGLLFGLYRVAHDALIRLVVLALHGCLVIIVLQQRRLVADWIRGRPDATGPMAIIRKRAARVWHIVALFYLVALWLVWAFDVPDGYARLIRIFVSTVVIVTLARLLSAAAGGMLERTLRIDPTLAARYPGLEPRLRRYHPVVRFTVNRLIGAIAAVVLFQAWGLDSLAWFEDGALGGRLVSALLTIGVTLLFALVAWEVANAAVQHHLTRLSRDALAARSARLLTLLPMLRTALFVSICLVAALIVLSEIGVNIAPLLAGAGVIGIAIGFGSQKLVQDVITGLFLLLENAMQVGDVVTLGGLTGSVENLSIRTIRLRAIDGSVHIVPFSAVTTVTNLTRDYGYAVLDLSVGLNEDPEHVADVVREVARDLRAEPRWANAIRDDIEIMGIEKFVDLAYVLRARLMTLPGQRWAVLRELNQRIKARFDDLAIESPITSFRALSHSPVLVPAARPPAEAEAESAGSGAAAPGTA